MEMNIIKRAHNLMNIRQRRQFRDELCETYDISYHTFYNYTKQKTNRVSYNLHYTVVRILDKIDPDIRKIVSN